MLMARRPTAAGASSPLPPRRHRAARHRVASALKSVSFSESRPTPRGDKASLKHAHSVTGSLVRIIMPPLFRPSPAPLPCDKRSLRWPGPFGSGFLSPQPPGIVGIGPVRRLVYPHTGPTRVGPFSFVLERIGKIECAGSAWPLIASFRGEAEVLRLGAEA